MKTIEQRLKEAVDSRNDGLAVKVESVRRFIASGKTVPEDFVLNPERYDRICHCSPRYSGTLR